MLRDANGSGCCVCTNCNALVGEAFVNFPNLHCQVCTQPIECTEDDARDVTDDAKGPDVSLHSASAKVTLQPPPGSKVRVMTKLPPGWMIGDVCIDTVLKEETAQGKNKTVKDTCYVLGCNGTLSHTSKSGKTIQHKSKVCDSCRPCGVYELKKDSFVHKQYCSRCQGWRDSNRWPCDQAGVPRKTCHFCSPDADGNIADRAELTRPSDGRATRHKHEDRTEMHGDHAPDGLLWSRWRGPPGDKRCHVRDCPNARVGRFYCEDHRMAVVNQVGLPGDYAQRRYCFKCQTPQPAWDFRWAGQCRAGCTTAGLQGRKKNSSLIPKLGRGVAGVAIPPGEPQPSLLEIRAAAVVLRVDVFRDDGTRGPTCCHETASGIACDTTVQEGSNPPFCDKHAPLVMLRVSDGQLVWCCPRCRVLGGLRACCSGVCDTCHAQDVALAQPCEVDSRATPGEARNQVPPHLLLFHRVGCRRVDFYVVVDCSDETRRVP